MGEILIDKKTADMLQRVPLWNNTVSRPISDVCEAVTHI